MHQEYVLLNQISSEISEIHLVDQIYRDLKYQDCDMKLALFEFTNHIMRRRPLVKLYIHSDPLFLSSNETFRRRIDILCGIDINWYANADNSEIIKRLAENVIKINGILITSHHHVDLVNICKHKLDPDTSKINLISSINFIKDKYYLKYKLQKYILCATKTIPNVALTCCIFYGRFMTRFWYVGVYLLVVSYLNLDKSPWWTYEIFRFSELIKDKPKNCRISNFKTISNYF